MNLITRQSGVTLLEVLVGFVIFTASLVAVLDYVSGQVYRNHLTSANLKKVTMVYDFSTSIELGSDQLPVQVEERNNLQLTVSASTMDASGTAGEGQLLNRYDYSVSDSSNSFSWAVIKLN